MKKFKIDRSSPLGRYGIWLNLIVFAQSSHIVWLMSRPYLPNQWPGDVGLMIVNLSELLLAMLIFVVLLALHVASRRWLACLALVICTFGPSYFQRNRSHAGQRFKEERTAYVDAVRIGRAYGDEYTERIDGRTLTYWRWLAWDLDNAIGIIYDPADRLFTDPEADRMAFRGPTKGVIFRVKRLEPHWFFVEHS